jgi:hypothetical protein
MCLFLGVVVGGASIRHLRQLDIHKPAYIWSVTLLVVHLYIGDYVSKYLHLRHHSWDVGANYGRGWANGAHHLLAPLLLIYIASVKFEARVGERCSNVPSLNKLFLIIVSTIFELVVVL